MRTRILYLLTGILVLVSLTKCDKAPTGPSQNPPPDLNEPQLLAPAEESDSLSTPIEFKWENIQEADEYNLQISNSADFSSTMFDSTIEGTTHIDSSLSLAETYYWRVRAMAEIDNENQTGPWSDSRQFNIISDQNKTITVELVSPSDGTVVSDASPMLDWQDVSAADQYHYQVSEDVNFSNLVVDSVLSLSKSEVSELQEDETYYWRVEPVVENRPAGWSKVYDFTIDQENSGTPRVSLSAPSNGASDLSRTPTFKWYSLSGVTDYKLEVAESSNFSNPVVTTTVSDTAHQVSQLNYDQQYYWRVQAVGDDNNQNWSSVRGFTTTAESTPAVSLTSPSDNATEIPTSPSFEWEALSGIDSYKLQVATSSSFSSPEVNTSVSSTSSQVSGLSEDQQYYWRVQAEGDNNSSNWSSTYSFTTVDSVPAVTLLSPNDGAADLSTSPTLEWEAISEISSYQLQVATSSSFTAPVVDQSVSNTSKALSGLNNDQQYYWRVQASGDNNDTNWSSAWSFTTKDQSTDGSGSVAGDRQALMDLYNATGGDNWNNNSDWGNGDPSSDWHGIEVDADGRVTRVDLFENNLQGQLPASIGDLDKVRYLNVKGNYLTGQIPSEIGNMDDLEILILQGRTYEIGGTRKEPPLDKMDTYSYHQGKYLSNTNDFSGQIPSTIGNLSNLIILEISNAPNITGPIPEEIGNLSNLQGLYMAWNDFAGETLPSSWGNLSSIKHIYLPTTGVKGSIPSSWSNLTTLVDLNIAGLDTGHDSNTELTGSIPDFSNFSNLRMLVLSKNGLTGDYPQYFNNGNFTDTHTLNLSWNNLTGTLPKFTNMGNLKSLTLSGNDVSGSIAPFTTVPSNIRIISAGWNNFSGDFPSDWPDFSQIKTLYLNDNDLTGSIPCSFWSKLDNPKLNIAWTKNNSFTDKCESGMNAVDGNGDVDIN